MQNDKKHINQKLNQELAHFSFTSKEKVLQKTHPKTWKQKIVHLLNKEISVPIVPIGVATVLFISVNFVPDFIDTQKDQFPRQMIEMGGNYYWSDLFDEVSRK